MEKKVFLLLLLLLTQTGWSLMEVLVYKRADSAFTSTTVVMGRIHMTRFSSANRNLSSSRWGL